MYLYFFISISFTLLIFWIDRKIITHFKFECKTPLISIIILSIAFTIIIKFESKTNAFRVYNKVIHGEINIDELFNGMTEESNKIFTDFKKNYPNERLLMSGFSVYDTDRSFFIGNKIVTEISYSLSKNWHILVYESPQEALNILKNLNIKYVILNTERLGIGALAFSPLFSKKSLNENFELVKKYNNKLLIKVSNKPSIKINNNDIEKYQSLINKSDYKYLYDNSKIIYERNNKKVNKKIVNDLDMLGVGGWQ